MMLAPSHRLPAQVGAQLQNSALSPVPGFSLFSAGTVKSPADHGFHCFLEPLADLAGTGVDLGNIHPRFLPGTSLRVL
jgi:hypothetical protein